ncbi:Nif3-like dinuclear metal center hexameric protein [uncultured Megasphaera sp.]|uniref:Nif3-like dinuclear metal center hexameric protein n=1 Tax=uncultured Megasphaera sp. TaxID=165188 RepID=UPI00259757F3|nr:Nif3-like dinuclear metal center hexameric protein [uncultured Megasphaera sp.]
MSIQLSKIIKVMESFAPPYLAEKWDNPGLLVGSPKQEIRRALVTLDVTKETAAFAAEKGYDLIISHHPVIFSKLANLRTDRYDGQLFQKLLSHNIAVYSAHTNWDSAARGVNDILAETIGLTNIRGLVPVHTEQLYKFAVYVPADYAEAVRTAMGDAGAGFIGGYSHCMFSVAGEGQFKPRAGTHPFIGTVGELEKTPEVRIETIIPASRLNLLLSAMKMAHPYEEPAFDIYPVDNEGTAYYCGRIGTLPQPETARHVLRKIKRALNLQILTYAGNEDLVVKEVALCGGAGASFIADAAAAGAQLYLTGDVKYHEAQDAVKRGMVIADGGHYGTEIISIPVLAQRLQAAAKERDWQVCFQADPTSKDMFGHC